MTPSPAAPEPASPLHRVQSELLTGAVGMALTLKAALVVLALGRLCPLPGWLAVALGGSVAFAVGVVLLRAATVPAASLGGVVCFNLLLARGGVPAWSDTPLPALAALFLLTFAATRFGRRRKERLGLAEPRRGRRASQVAANLGVAGLCGGAHSPLLLAATLAALAEATADTVSSELGQALGGRTLLLTTLRDVPPGTDGGISVAGTTLGSAAAGAILLVTAATRPLATTLGLIAFAAALAGLLADSLIGATLERRGWLGNDLVNFLSTALAAALAYAAAAMWL